MSQYPTAPPPDQQSVPPAEQPPLGEPPTEQPPLQEPPMEQPPLTDPGPPDAANEPEMLGSPGPSSGGLRDPEQWATGDEPMTEAQKSYLDTLAREAGEQIPADLTKAEASQHIDRLQKGSNRLG